MSENSAGTCAGDRVCLRRNSVCLCRDWFFLLYYGKMKDVARVFTLLAG